MDQPNTSTKYGEAKVTGGSASAIDGATEEHAYVGMSVDEISDNITFRQGAIVDLTGATFATADGGAKTQITGVVHGRAIGEIITITGCSTAGYNDVGLVTAVGGASDFTVDIAFVDDPVTDGNLRCPDSFLIGDGAKGAYEVNIGASGFIGTSSATLAFSLYSNKTLKHKVRRKFANANDVGAWGLTGLVSVVAGDIIWLAILNEDNGNDVTIGEQSFIIHRLS